MDLPRVNTCCFGLLPLKIGALVCGVISIIVELGSHGYTAIYSQSHNISLVYKILLVCGILGSILLIIGVLTNQPRLAQLYIIAYILLILFTIIMLIWAIVDVRQFPTDLVVSVIVYICVVGYCLIVVNSYRYTMG